VDGYIARRSRSVGGAGEEKRARVERVLFRGGGRGEIGARFIRSSISGKAGSRGRPSVRDETRRLAARSLCQNARACGRPINSPPGRGRPSVVSHLPESRSLGPRWAGWIANFSSGTESQAAWARGRSPWSRGLVRITPCHHRLWSAAVGSDGIGVGWDPWAALESPRVTWAGVAAGSWKDTMMLIRPCGRCGGVQLSISKGSASSARPPPKSAPHR